MPIFVALALYGGAFIGYCLGESHVFDREETQVEATHGPRHLIHFRHRKAEKPVAPSQEPPVILDVDVKEEGGVK